MSLFVKYTLMNISLDSITLIRFFQKFRKKCTYDRPLNNCKLYNVEVGGEHDVRA